MTMRLPKVLIAMMVPLLSVPQLLHADDKPVEKIRVSSAAYHVPNVQMVRQDGKPVSLPAELDDGRPVVMNFIFTTCESICPLMTQSLAQFQRKLGAEGTGVHMVSISIDPEEDTPARLREYAKEYKTLAGWSYYTGTEAASIKAQQAFNVYRGDKMSHAAVTMLRAAPGDAWRRIDGFVTPDDLVREYHAMAAR